MNWDLFFKFTSLGLPLASVIYTFIATRRKDVDRRFNEGSKRMEALALRVQTVEQTVASMPGQKDMHSLEVALVEMSGDMKAMRATLRGMAESVSRTEGIVSRHEDYLRESR